jgi:hypothetical protein
MRAALGLRAHSGWAVMVAVAGPRRAPAVIERRRIEMVESNTMAARQPYHAAAEVDLKAAAQLIERSAAGASRLAERAIRDAIGALRSKGYQVDGCAVLTASGRPLPELRAILGSHPMIHAAEGEMFRNALADAGAHCSLSVVRQSERELLENAAAKLGVPASELLRRASDMGKSVGRPWRVDEKHATLAAWMLLP